MNGFVLCGGIVACALWNTGASAHDFTHVATHSDAAAQPTDQGKGIRALASYNGRVYMGYGDYANNTGPIAFWVYEPSTLFLGSVATFGTEAIISLRVDNGVLKIPMADPCDERAQCAGAQGWAVHAHVGSDNAVEIFRDEVTHVDMGDICATEHHVYGQPQQSPVYQQHYYDRLYADGYEWMVASNGNAKGLFRSTDGGATWINFFSAYSYERAYYLAPFEGEAFCMRDFCYDPGDQRMVPNSNIDYQGSDISPFQTLDSTGERWQTVFLPSSSGPAYRHFDPGSSGDRIVIQTSPNHVIGESITRFEDVDPGPGVSTVFALSYRDASVDSEKAVYRGYPEMTEWEFIGEAPETAFQVTADESHVYIGTTDSQLYRIAYSSGGGDACGDGVCAGGETCDSCVDDCGVCDVCGDGVCGGDETCDSCEVDCGACVGTITVTESGTVAEGQWLHYGPYHSTAGIDIMMTGSGDADLYVRRSAPPTYSDYDCRPYDADSSESCSLTGDGMYYVSVSGYARTSGFELLITYTSGASATCGDGLCSVGETCDGCVDDCGVCDVCGDGACGGGETCDSCEVDCGVCVGPITAIESATVAEDQWLHYGPYHAEDGLDAVMTGTGDADLYVRRSARPTYSDYDCRPYDWESNETCSFEGGGVYYVSVNGYARTSELTLAITYTPTAVSCGDGACDAAEDCSMCAVDCGPCGGNGSLPMCDLATVCIPYGDTWWFDDSNTDHGDAWQTASFDHASWPTGSGQLGFGDGDESTVVADVDGSYYFRKQFSLAAVPMTAVMSILYDDGVAVFLNGSQVFSENVGNGLAHEQWASATSWDNEVETLSLTASDFVVGDNTMAVVIKNRSARSSDVSFDLELILGN